MKTFLFTYNHDGAQWNLEIQATSVEDAKARIGKIAYATYDGELIARIPAQVGMGAKAAVAIQNTIAAIYRGLTKA